VHHEKRLLDGEQEPSDLQAYFASDSKAVETARQQGFFLDPTVETMGCF